MVDALEAVRRVLRRSGHVVELAPDLDYQPRVSLRDGSRSLAIGVIRRDPDPDIAAARRAVERVVAAQAFRIVVAATHGYGVRFPSLADLEREVRWNHENWTMPTDVRRRLRAAWRRRSGGAVIVIEKAFSLTVLRKLGS